MTYKNSAYQRGASRHQPQPPAAEPAKTLPGWVWMVGGILIGTLVVFFLDFNSSKDKGSEEVASAPAQPTEAHPTSNTGAATSSEPPKPKYDFYTLLPDSKVILPPGAVEEPPPPTAHTEAKPESPLANAALPAAAAVTAVAAAALASKAMQSNNNAAPPPNNYQLSPPSHAVTVTAPTKPSAPTAPKPAATPAPAKPATAQQAQQPVQPKTPPASAATTTPAKPVAATVTAPVATAAKPTTTTTAPAAMAAKPVTPAPEATPAPTLAKLQNPPSATTQVQAQAQKPAQAQAAKLFLQAGSFRKADDADRTRAEMLLMGVNARVETTTVRGETWHRVLVGPYNSQDKLDQARKELSSSGYSNLVPQKR